MEHKIALEEHWDSPEFDATGSHDFVDEAYFAEAQRRLHEVDERVRDMDANGIDVSILSLTQPGIEGIPDAARAVETARRMNDYCAEQLVERHPHRLRAFAAVPLQDPERAVDELERAVTDLGFVGVLVNGYSNIGDSDTGRYLDAPEVDPFWTKLEELDVPLYLHPRIPLPGQRRIYEGYDGIIGSAWGFGAETAVHALRIILSGLLDRHPTATVILGHMGEGLPFTLPRLQMRIRHLHAHGAHRRQPMEYLRDNFRLTTAGIQRSQALLNALLEVGADRILFSVDYPYEDMFEMASWFDGAPISENDRVKIGRTNAEELFRLDRR